MAPEQDATIDRLKNLIKGGSGRLPPERELATKFGVSRRKIREALEYLERAGHIRRRQGAGTFVRSQRADGHDAPPSDIFARAIELTNPVEVLEVRLAIEPTLARLASLRASKSDIEMLSRLATATEQAATPEAYEEADATFHREIARTARNALFLAVFDAVIAAIESVSWHGVRETAHCSKNKAVYAKYHHDITAAIGGRNAARAEELMFAHLKHVQDQLLAAAQPRASIPASVTEAAA
jgi:DNA-binding FadR family transcriptional regulator